MDPVQEPAEASEDTIFVEFDTRFGFQLGEESKYANPGYLYVGVISFIVASILMVILTACHRRKVYQDLSPGSKSRQILFAHRISKGRQPPPITSLYKTVNLLTFYSMVLFTFSSVSGLISLFAGSDFSCSIFIQLIIAFVAAAKTLMYLVFLLRLQRIFDGTIFGYGPQIVFANEGSSFPNLCQAANVEQFYQFASGINIENIAVSIGFMWAYKIPLQQLEEQFKDKPRILKRLKYSGHKLMVLVGTATIATVILNAATALTQLGIFTVPDPIINAICLMFMTAYYDDAIYYKRYCKPCILCCHSHNIDAQLASALIDDESHAGYASADTASQVRIAAKQLRITKESTAKAAQEMQSIPEKQEEKEVDATLKEDNCD